MKTQTCIWIFLFFSVNCFVYAQDNYPDNFNLIWKQQSSNSSGSMPCGGGDIGLNVWVENNELLIYFSRSGTFDENNEFLKLGRIRVRLNPDPFKGKAFTQLLELAKGQIKITGGDSKLSGEILIWADVFSPDIHIDINASKAISAEVFYENWRCTDQLLRKNESFANSYKWAPPKGLIKHKDEISFHHNYILFYHKNKDTTVFDVTVKQQGLDSVKDQLYNPLHHLTFGGLIQAENMVPVGTSEGTYQDTDFKAWRLKSAAPKKRHEVIISLYTAQTENTESWKATLLSQAEKAVLNSKSAKDRSQKWWTDFWNRSFIIPDPDRKNTESGAWQIGRNYQLFRYMLGCNAYGSYPTKFNGGLFTFDPCFVNPKRCFTPDFRNWGGGTFTAQNQRLVYFPMLKSGDFDLMKSQFEFYNRLLKNAELRSSFYWGHEGACFTEQIENYGLPNPSEYSWKRPDWYDKGMQFNAWLEYQWDTALEICFMILEQYNYRGTDISEYIELIYSCIKFFDEHYTYLAKKRGIKTLDQNGHLVLYPGSSCETYKMAYNATSTIAGLTAVISKILDLPGSFLTQEMRTTIQEIQDKIPPVAFREIDGKPVIAPAELWERINNTEAPQLYPVFPYGLYGFGKPGLDTAINTYRLDPDLKKFRSHVGWKQDNIFAARLGLTEEAWKYTTLKLQDSELRFPAFWGPGFDWTPDHNWGGSGMIGLQEMLLQSDGEKIFLFPAWPENIDVHFKLHTYNNTIVEAKLKNGEPEIITVTPEERKKDIEIRLKKNKN